MSLSSHPALVTTSSLRGPVQKKPSLSNFSRKGVHAIVDAPDKGYSLTARWQSFLREMRHAMGTVINIDDATKIRRQVKTAETVARRSTVQK